MAELDPLIVKIRADMADFASQMTAVKASVTDMQAKMRTATDSMSSGMSSSMKTFKEHTKAVEEHSKALGLNRMQMMELGHSARAMTDMLIAGMSPMRAMMMEAPRLAQTLGQGGLGRTMLWTGGTVLGLGLAIGGTLALMKSWATEYRALDDAAKLTGTSINDLVRMQQIASKTTNNYDVTKGYADFGAKLYEAQVAGGKLAQMLEKNGIAIKEANGAFRDQKAILVDIANLVSKTQNGYAKQEFANQLGLGRDSVEFLEKYADAIKKGNTGLSEAEKHLLAMKEHAVEIDKKFNDMAETIGTKIKEGTINALQAFGDYADKLSSDNSYKKAMDEYQAYIAALKEESDSLVPIMQEAAAQLQKMRDEFIGLAASNNADGLNRLTAEMTALEKATQGELDRYNELQRLMQQPIPLQTTFIKRTWLDDQPLANSRVLQGMSGRGLPATGAPKVTEGGIKPSSLFPVANLDELQKYILGLQKANDILKAQNETFGQSKELQIFVKNMAEARAIAEEHHLKISQAQVQQIREQSAVLAEQQKIQAQLNRRLEEMQQIGNDFTSALDDWIVKGNSFNDVMSNLARTMASMALKDAFTNNQGQNIIGNLLGGLFGGSSLPPLVGTPAPGIPLPPIPGRAIGGPVMAGVPYIVGENGPELMIPNNAGTVMTNNRTNAMMGGSSSGSSGVTIVQNITVNGSMSTSERAAFAKQVEASTLAAAAEAKKRGR